MSKKPDPPRARLTAVIEYEFAAYTAPGQSDAWGVDGCRTRLAGTPAGFTLATDSDNLYELRCTLEEEGFEPHGVQSARRRNRGRFCPTWREVWTRPPAS